ncbi:MAG: DoxX family protein [Candidatus Spechtbacterales bacterium]|nr:DoxX family protein [Candidatus Spechtbacterales bacterium]
MLFNFTQYADIALFVARVIAGITMMYYGQLKIRDLKKNARDFVEMGFKPGWFWGTPVAINEFFGGLAIVLGVYIWIPAALFAVQMMGGAIWKITKTDKPFTDWSYDLLLFALMLVLITAGSGAFALI